MRNLLVFLGVVLLASCSKERSLHISAKNADTGAPYPGLTYYVVEEKTGNQGEEFTTVATGQLDSNGEKMVAVKIKKNRSYTIRVAEPPNWCYNKKVSYSYAIQDDSSPHFVFEFAECAYLKLNINNVNCQGTTDTMNFRSRYSYSNWEGWSTDRTGCYIFNAADFIQVPQGWRIYNWMVKRGGVQTEFTDSVYLSSGAQVVFNMNY
jgi:hypothetical protein